MKEKLRNIIVEDTADAGGAGVENLPTGVLRSSILNGKYRDSMQKAMLEGLTLVSSLLPPDNADPKTLMASHHQAVDALRKLNPTCEDRSGLPVRNGEVLRPRPTFVPDSVLNPFLDSLPEVVKYLTVLDNLDVKGGF